MPYSSISSLLSMPELLLDGDLDRQAVAVPAALALDEVAAHRLEARVDVLEDAREDVVRAGPAVGGRRALVEDPRLGALAAAQRLREDVALAPALEHLLLERRGTTAAGSTGRWAMGPGSLGTGQSAQRAGGCGRLDEQPLGGCGEIERSRRPARARLSSGPSWAQARRLSRARLRDQDRA